MAPKKKPRADLSKSAKFYRDNPQARKKKASTDKEINSRPEQKKKRRESGRARTKAKASGKDVRGKDMSHTKKGIIMKNTSANRGSKSDSAGDKRARGGKRK